MDYIDHLKKDKKFATIILGPVHERVKPHKNIMLQLIGSIMSQQLNVKVAKIIYNRFLELYKNKTPTAKQIADTSIETLRSIGLSNAKASYVKNVAAFVEEHNITDKQLHAMNNDEIIELLTQIKGVGKWTVEMLLMFALGREDVFSIDDYGVQKAIIKLYKLNKLDKKQQREKILKLSKKWSPYRTYACLYCWHWLNNTPVKTKQKSSQTTL